MTGTSLLALFAASLWGGLPGIRFTVLSLLGGGGAFALVVLVPAH